MLGDGQRTRPVARIVLRGEVSLPDLGDNNVIILIVVAIVVIERGVVAVRARVRGLRPSILIVVVAVILDGDGAGRRAAVGAHHGQPRPAETLEFAF
jgi:hypothetical protein